jgi:serine/threonine protein kinase
MASGQGQVEVAKPDPNKTVEAKADINTEPKVEAKTKPIIKASNGETTKLRCCWKATVGLAKVYNKIRIKCSVGVFQPQEGELLMDRYKIVRVVGKAVFGIVVHCIDTQRQKDVAIKVIRALPNYLRQAKHEIAILRFLQEQNVPGVIKIRANFKHKEHLCIVFDLLSYNLYQLVKENQVSMHFIRLIAKQLMEILQRLSKLSQPVTHADIKPENVMVCHQSGSDIALIDFGSAVYTKDVEKRENLYIQSRWYRAPEVFFQLPLDSSIDVWSCGCVLAELYTGVPLFPGMDSMDQLRKMVSVLGQPPSAMLKKLMVKESAACKKLCDEKATTSITQIIQESRETLKLSPAESADQLQFIDLLKKMLVYGSNARIKPEQALAHSFFCL